MNLIQEMIDIQWKECFHVELPNQRFFKPKANFWEILKGLELKCLVDCGCGNGELVKEGIDLGFRISGCDIHKRDGVPFGLVQIIPAHKIPFNNDIHALVCRPDHSGWCGDLISHAISKGAKFIYVGLKDNLYRDIPEHIKYKVLSEIVGEENEVMILIEKE